MSTRQKKTILGIIILCISHVSVYADSDWEYFSETGNYYKRFDIQMTWDDAKIFAEGLGGWLVTVTSQSENDFLWNTLVDNQIQPSHNAPWLGGYQPLGTTWEWVTGETWDYTNWAMNQPDNALDGQDFAKFTSGGTWDDYGGPWDAPSSSQPATIIVENTVPEPATLLLLGLGSLALRRKRRTK